MREDIKERIKILRRGEVPEGYKNTKVGIFPYNWDELKLGQLLRFQNGINADKEKFGIGVKIVSVMDILNQNPITYENIRGMIDIDEEMLERYSVSYGDVLFQRSSENIEDAGKSNIYMDDKNIATFGGFVIRGRKIADYNPIIFNEVLKSEYVRKQIMKLAAGVQHINISQKSLREVSVIIPNEGSQDYIENIINKYQKLEELQNAYIKQKILYKKWFMQNLLTAKKRIKGYKSNWKKIKIKKLVKELNEKTTKNNQYEILSVTKEGIFKQSEHFNKQIASEDNCGYKVIRKNNLVFSTMNLWMGSLDVLKKYDIGIVSPAYKIFEFDNDYMVSEFGEYFMKSNYLIWIYGMNSEQGASVVRKNLDLDGLLNTFVIVPAIEEQKAIAKILSHTDKEIELLHQQLEQIKLEKKAMMQLLLTGIVRVN